MSTTTLENVTVEEFLDVFLAALVLRGKRYIWVRTDAAHEERRRMLALYKFVCKFYELSEETASKDRQYALLKLRNHLAPSPTIGSFDNLHGSILRKMPTIISIDLLYCHTYDIELQAVIAKCWLERSDPELRKFVEDAADAYMAPLVESVRTSPA